jgi:hypothetical protein
MYRYNLVNNDEFKKTYKKYIRKKFLKGNLILVSIVTILLFLSISLSLKIFYQDKTLSFPIVIIILIILEVFFFFIAYKKERQGFLSSIYTCEINLSFNEKGILINQDDIEKHINWNAIRTVIVDNDNLLFNFNVTGFPGNSFIFKFFDAPKDEIINDLKKYTKVKELK